MLALLLAERAVAAELTGDLGALLLDDVMSELDDARRRLLVGALTAGGQAIITTTNRLYFTAGELAGSARVIELAGGAAEPAGDAPMAEFTRLGDILNAASPASPAATRAAPIARGRGRPAATSSPSPARAACRAACSPWSASRLPGRTSSPISRR